MGARAAAIGCVLLAAGVARAGEPERACEDLDRRGHPYATCFDPGNRLVVGGAHDLDGFAFEAAIEVRHDVPTDDPSIAWRFEHRLLSAQSGMDRFDGGLYAGRFMRHSRDGHVVLPTSPPKKVFLPFDVGAEVAIGRVHGLIDAPDLRLDVVRAVALIDLARSADFRRRLAVGPVAEWDVVVTRDDPHVTEHALVPFSALELALYAEDRPGLTLARVAVEGGLAWSNETGWGRRLAGEASIERVVIAVNDRPVSVFVAGRYDEGFYANAGIKLALISSAR